ncbi:sulfite reductase subunit C [Candidatus Formimonas warabiya]|uniref:Sulfite reductase subunit C n=1 Tax=Formimonas warabiya TaxID=1761012 RepID=A0A3G1KZ24_FORW1|nr:sulfite reductase subunit C [Candidatus Formimonas warabiya]ATW27711.1 sulfite reductase subunit C [Candidatus Formimonas warabiya]
MQDMNTKKLKKNAYRITKERGITALRIRVPGGHLPIKFFDVIKTIAEKYGNGSVHITTRQGFEIPGIRMEDMEEINQLILPLINDLKGLGVPIPRDTSGYPASGTRNISACIGNRVCQYANYDTTALAYEIEKAVYPHDFHVKIALTGCPNDCIKAHMQDFGIIGQVEPHYQAERCVGCQACVKNCRKRVTGALQFINEKVVRDAQRCIGCGECILKCPTSAWTRGKNFYRVIIMGRTGKKNPRLAQTFLEWVEIEPVIQIIQNTYQFIDKYIDRSLDKEHIGYIIDREGYQKFQTEVLTGVVLNKEAHLAQSINYQGYHYNRI